MYLNFASLFTNDEKELLYGPSLKELSFSETILEENSLKNQIEKENLRGCKTIYFLFYYN